MMSGGAAQNIITFIAHGAKVDVHRHHCFQIVVSINQPFECTLGGELYKNMTGFIINQNVPHSCRGPNASVFVYLVDAESYYGWQLKEMLAGETFVQTDAFFFDDQRKAYFAEGNQLLPKESLRQMADEVFDIILSAPTEQPSETVLDERVLKAVEFVETRLQENLRLEDVADLMRLSPERARHLFAQATGVPFSQFVLWRRLRNVITLVLRDHSSMSDAALESGFADQAHFCRTFKRMFGVSAKPVLKNSRYVQFLNPLA